jgi:hypothetical protein
MPGNPMYDIDKTLVPVRRVLGGLRLLTSLERGITCGALVGAALLGMAHLSRFPWAPHLSLLALGLGAVAGLVVGLDRWPTTLRAARVADSHFSLYDGLTTALEFESSQGILPLLQRSHLKRKIQGLRLTRSRRGHLRARDTLVMLLALGLAAILFVIPTSNPSSTVVAATPTDAARISGAANAGVPATIHNINRGLTADQKSDPAIRQLNIRLALLRHQLLEAKTRAQALRDISLAQSQIQKAAQGQRPVSQTAIAQLNQDLKHYFRQHGNLKPSSNAASSARSLKNLAQSLSGLKASSERNKVASLLEKAANSNKDKRLKRSLSKAAKALVNNAPKKASSALRRAAGLLSQAPKARRNRKRLISANSQLDSLKNRLSGVQKGRGLRPKLKGNSRPIGRRGGQGGGRSGGKSGRGSSGNSGTNKNGSPSQSAPPGSAGAVFGVVKRTGAASNGAQAIIVKARKFGTGGVLAGNASTTRSRGRFSTVYVPGAKGLGIEIIQSGQKQGSQAGSLIPYRLVLVRYTRSANVALSRVNLPPKLQAYVRDYFLAISQ